MAPVNIPFNLNGDLKLYYLSKRLNNLSQKLCDTYQVTAYNPSWPEDPDAAQFIDECVAVAEELSKSVKKT